MPQIEQTVYNMIANFQSYFPNTSSLTNQLGFSLDILQTFLYFSWHRCHVEERAYPSAYGYNGRGDYLGATYILLANRYRLCPLDKTLQKNRYSDPQNVYYDMANNSNSKQQKSIAFQNYLSFINQNQQLPL